MSDFDFKAHFAERVAVYKERQRVSGGIAAMEMVAWARRKKLLADPRTLTCVDCGGPASRYDHRDYGRPLDVVPVCRSCNRKRGPAVPAWSDDPDTRLVAQATGFVLCKTGIAAVSFEAVDFYPMPQNGERQGVIGTLEPLPDREPRG